MLLKRIIIIAGARNAGKTTTLRKLTENFVHSSGQNLHKYNGKLICVYISSPQEQIPFCHDDEVSDMIDSKIGRCNKKGCSLLILSFTIWIDRKGQLNFGCIKKPVEKLKKKGFEVHIVYLRRADVVGIEQMDELMDGFKEQTITSNEEYDAQAKRLLKIVDQIDP